jgi:hypothetical protein
MGDAAGCAFSPHLRGRVNIAERCGRPGIAIGWLFHVTILRLSGAV